MSSAARGPERRLTEPGRWTYVGLGSNLGDPGAMLRAAAARLAQLGTVTARSSLYSTAPLGGPSGQADYLNAVIALDLPDGDARELLRALLAIERDLGRVRNERWGPRIIDLDLLAVGDRVVGRQEGPDPGGPGNGADLVLPHPRIAERAFVLAPLCEIARRRNETGRAWVHPLTGLDACGMLAALATGVTRPPSLSDDLGVRRTDLRW